jgi:transcriptional regulator
VSDERSPGEGSLYSPHAFVETDADRIHVLVETYDFATLVAVTPDGGAEIAHLPFLLDRPSGSADERADERAKGKGRLLVHVARANPIWRTALAGAPLTVVFQGPHGYVSAGWYEEPARQVPTWNYAVVHVHGRAQGPMDTETLLAMLDRLARRQEASSARPWRIEDMDPDTREGLAKGIVGFTIPIERIEAKFKLSQNRTADDRARVREALNERGRPDDRAMVDLMDGGRETAPDDRAV